MEIKPGDVVMLPVVMGMTDAEITELRAELADPLKTTVVHGQRSMTTWVLRRTS